MRARAVSYDDAQFRILIPGVGWRKVINSRYLCPHSRTDQTRKGLRGTVSIQGERVKLLWIPDAPISLDLESGGELLLLG